MSETFDLFQQMLKEKRYRDAAGLAEKENQKSAAPDPFWLTQLAVANLRAGDHEHALGAARQAMSADPSNPYALMAAADALVGLDRGEEALSLYQEALPFARATPRARRGMLDCLARLSRWDRLLELLAEWALPVEESAPWKAKALAGLGRLAEAIEECTRWLERSPDAPPALWALTELEVERDGIEAVLGRMERTVRIPSLPPVYREIYASLCRRAGRPEAALKEYEKLEAQGAGARVQKKQAFLLARSGKEREALPLLEELLRAEPTDMYLHSSYEAACKRVGELERAINFYNVLIGLRPEARALHGRIRNLRRALEKTS